MPDINAIISLGIGSPASIRHFILLGLNSAPIVIGTPDENAFLYGAFGEGRLLFGADAETAMLEGQSVAAATLSLRR